MSLWVLYYWNYRTISIACILKRSPYASQASSLAELSVSSILSKTCTLFRTCILFSWHIQHQGGLGYLRLPYLPLPIIQAERNLQNQSVKFIKSLASQCNLKLYQLKTQVYLQLCFFPLFSTDRTAVS